MPNDDHVHVRTTGRPKGATITYGMVDCLTSHWVAKVWPFDPIGKPHRVADVSHQRLNTYANPVILIWRAVLCDAYIDARLCLKIDWHPRNRN